MREGMKNEFFNKKSNVEFYVRVGFQIIEIDL